MTSPFSNSAALREAFLSFFESKQHTRVSSSSLVPGNDPTLLFTNAGMVQFKDVFLGDDKRDYCRAVTSQRCVRAGGKHNDLENVGYTARHHTFFEMLGNFSFGDYFKQDAIHNAWEFLTCKDWLAIPAEKLTVTVYADDDEAYAIWQNEIGVPVERIIRIGDKGGEYQSDNFWAMGDTGPCGPCTEIFYDHGEDIWGGPPGSPEEDGDRFIEIWNLVFMQFNRTSDGVMNPLPKPSVDTGMGLERIAAVMQDVHSNYEIDMFQNLLSAVAKATNATDKDDKSLRVIADHIRSCAFLIVDGVIPANEGRGYVLRRIIRRAVRHGHKLGQTETFFYTLVNALVDEMGEAYPELTAQQAQVEKVLLAEEQQFEKTLEKGLGLLEIALGELSGKEIPADVIFKLHGTYGFPTDLTNDIARERGYSLDMDGYHKLMEEEKLKNPDAFTVDYNKHVKIDGSTAFIGYESLLDKGNISALFKNGQAVDQLVEGDEGIVVLNQTPFYAESGGQVGDTGYLSAGENRFEVGDCQKNGDNHCHIGRVLSGALSIGDELLADVDNTLRQAIVLNHSATHLMHAALRNVLGGHVVQKGSLVDSEKLRFDFSHFESVTAQELQAIEQQVNDEIRRNTATEIEVCSMDNAKEKGAMMLFGEKYGSEVRVLTMGGGYSVELCGGTHVERTGDIGLFRIISESGVAAGIRRIEAVTGKTALKVLDRLDEQVQKAAQLVKANPANLLEKLEQLMATNKAQEKQLAALQAKMASAASGDLLSQIKEVAGVNVLACQIEGANAKTLREVADSIKSKLEKGVFLLAAIDGEKVALITGVTKDLVSQYKAGDLMREVAPIVGGKGGGRPDMAQGAGSNLAGIKDALAFVEGWVAKQ